MKTLVVSGCSFTFEPWNWPTFVSEHIDYKLINIGMGSTGNGLISKKVIYKVNELLKTHKPEYIIVGVMWSGIDRTEFFYDHRFYNEKIKNDEGWLENPTSVCGFGTLKPRKNWVIGNIHWDEEKSKVWYEHLHTDVGATITTIENILRTQWYLEKCGVKYFMSTYMDIFNSENMKVLDIMRNVDVKYLYEMIDFDKFLPVSGCHEWVKDHYPEKGYNSPTKDGYVGIHPTKFGHKMFAEEVIIPFIDQNILS